MILGLALVFFQATKSGPEPLGPLAALSLSLSHPIFHLSLATATIIFFLDDWRGWCFHLLIDGLKVGFVFYINLAARIVPKQKALSKGCIFKFFLNSLWLGIQTWETLHKNHLSPTIACHEQYVIK